MARLATLRKGQWDQFDRLLNATDLTAEEVLQLIAHPEVLMSMLAAMRQHLVFRLIHGVFNPTANILAAFKARCAAKGIDFDRFSWVGSALAGDFDLNDPETVVVLDATFATLQQTFEFAWDWTVDGQDSSWRNESMLSDAEHLALLDDLEFTSWTLRWVRIKLDTNVNKKPIDIRDPKSSPGCALLFMSAEHPARIKTTDYEKCFGFWLPGLKCTVHGDEKLWRHVPYVLFNLDNRRVRLNLDWYDRSSNGFLAMPVLRE